MAPVTFVCDLCGAPGLAEAAGAAQCKTCGQVALVLGSSLPPDPSPDPFAVAGRASDGGAPDDVDLVLDDEVTPRPPVRLASLWVPPGRDGGPTPEPGSVPPFRRVKRSRRAVAAAGVLAAGAALALGVAVGTGFVDLAPGGEEGGSLQPSAGPGASEEPSAPPSPAVEAPPPPRAVPAAVRPAARGDSRPAPVTAPSPLPAPGGESLRGLQASAVRNPTPVDRQCVPRTLRERPDVAERLPDEIRARFPVAASGAIGPVEVIGEVPDPEVADAIEEAIRSCPFLPGADEEGRPVPLSVVMRIRFAVQ